MGFMQTTGGQEYTELISREIVRYKSLSHCRIGQTGEGGVVAPQRAVASLTSCSYKTVSLAVSGQQHLSSGKRANEDAGAITEETAASRRQT